MRMRFFIVYAGFILIMAMLRGEIGVSDYFRLDKSRLILLSALNNLEAEQAYLKDEITKLTMSKEYALKVLKDRYHIVGENEYIIFFNDI